jgi:hypothetical protein
MTIDHDLRYAEADLMHARTALRRVKPPPPFDLEVEKIRTEIEAWEKRI